MSQMPQSTQHFDARAKASQIAREIDAERPKLASATHYTASPTLRQFVIAGIKALESSTPQTWPVIVNALKFFGPLIPVPGVMIVINGLASVDAAHIEAVLKALDDLLGGTPAPNPSA